MTDDNMLMTCDRFVARVSEYVDHELDAATAAQMEAHAATCPDCAALLADLEAMRADAARLPELVPSGDLWGDVARRIETPVVELRGGEVGLSTKRGYPSRAVWLGLAAAGLVAVTATVTREMTKHSVAVVPAMRVASQVPAQAPVVQHDTVLVPVPMAAVDTTPARTTPSPAANAADPTRRLASNGDAREKNYDAEIARLRTIVTSRRSQLDSATIAVLEHNLHVIDVAIAQCKDALRKDPASRYLLESLDDALDTKVTLLRVAAALPART